MLIRITTSKGYLEYMHRRCLLNDLFVIVEQHVRAVHIRLAVAKMATTITPVRHRNIQQLRTVAAPERLRRTFVLHSRKKNPYGD